MLLMKRDDAAFLKDKFFKVLSRISVVLSCETQGKITTDNTNF